MADNPQVSVEIQDDSLPTLATSALQTTGNASLSSIDAKVATAANQSTLNTRVGDLTETAPGTDTASSGLNGRLQRIAQRLTSIFTAQSDGSQQTKIRGATDGTLIGNNGDVLKVAPRGVLATYSATVRGLNVVTSPTDIFLIKGSATKVVKVRRIFITGYQNNASYQDILLIKRSTDNTGGTRASITPVSYDSSDGAGTAQVFRYTANPSALGTAVGTLLAISKMFTGKNSAVGIFAEFLFGAYSPQKPITLRNDNEYLAVNFDGVTMAGSNLDITAEWTEE